MMDREAIIGIDASRSYRAPMTGTERYSRRIIEQLVQLESQGTQYRLYFNQAPPAEANLATAGVRTIPARRFWTHYRLSRELRQHPVDLLFVPSHVLPLYHPERSVVTVHDLGYLYEPESHTRMSRLQLRATTDWNARRASHLIAISESTKRDLIQHCNVAPERVSVIGLGIEEQFKVHEQTEIERYRRAARLPERFVLYLGTIQPRKNLVRLVSAFEQLASDDHDLHLVLAGRAGWMSSPIRERVRASPFANRIRFLGHVPDPQLPLLYGAASAVTLVSLYEGFGMPSLEAMACGTPVVMSNRGGLPELSGADAEVVNPVDIEGISRGIEGAIRRRDDQQLIKQRTRHASEFTWESAAEKTRDVLWHALNR